MRYLRNLFGAVGVAFTLLAAFHLSAFALTSPPTFAPRNFQTQQVGYLRINVFVSSSQGLTMNGLPCVLVSNACTVKVGALPYNAYVIRATQQIITNFNSGSGTDNLSIGTTSANGNELVAAQSVHSGAGNQSSLSLQTTGSGIQVTGNGTAQTGTDGGFDVYVKFANTSGSAPTAGQAIIILEFIAPNDGTCTDPGLGVTPTGAAAAC